MAHYRRLGPKCVHFTSYLLCAGVNTVMANLVWHMLATWEGARVQRRGCGLEGRGSGRNGGEGERACGVRGIIIGRGGEGGERGKAREMEEKMKPTIIIISTM